MATLAVAIQQRALVADAIPPFLARHPWSVSGCDVPG
jgi:hypothetical protein